MAGRSAEGFTLIDPYSKYAQYVGLVERKHDDSVGDHYQIIWVAEKIIDQRDGERDSRPGHKQHPRPAPQLEEGDEDDDTYY